MLVLQITNLTPLLVLVLYIVAIWAFFYLLYGIWKHTKRIAEATERLADSEATERGSTVYSDGGSRIERN